MKAEVKMVSIPESCVLDEQALFADLFEEVPAECIDLFRRVKFGIAELLTVNEEDFVSILAVNSPPFEVAQIWKWIANWRRRNVSRLEKDF